MEFFRFELELGRKYFVWEPRGSLSISTFWALLLLIFQNAPQNMGKKPEIQEKFHLTRSSSVWRSALHVLAQHVPEYFTAGTESLYLSSNNSREGLTGWNAPGSGCRALISFPVFPAERQLGWFMGCPAFLRAVSLKYAPKLNSWGGIPRGTDKFRSVVERPLYYTRFVPLRAPQKNQNSPPQKKKKNYQLLLKNRGQAPELAILFQNNGARLDENYFNTSEGCQVISFSFIDFFRCQ